MNFVADISGVLGWVGLVIVVVAGLIVLLFAAALATALLASKSRWVPASGAALLLLEIFFMPLGAALRIITGDGFAAEKLGVRICNQSAGKRYAAVPLDKRVVFVPQCLRDRECPARLSSKDGFECRECGKCVISEIRRLAPGVRVFVSPGGSFSRRILMRHRPEAVLGVACPPDLFEGLQAARRARIPAQGVALSRAGCVSTDVSIEAVREKLLLGAKSPGVRDEVKT